MVPSNVRQNSTSKHGTYEYVLEGTDGDGRPLEIVFAIGHRHVFLITGRRP